MTSSSSHLPPLTAGMPGGAQDDLPVFFFDIDNCLYSKSKRVHDMMQDLIDKYFREKLELDPEDAKTLHETYYKNYGLAIEGLVRHHKIDPLEYNRRVDDALPLETILHPDPELRELISGIDKTKVRLWLFTNAYITHGKRVVKLLEIGDLFDGITYCDYGKSPLICKPKPEMYEKGRVYMDSEDLDLITYCIYVHLAMKEASITDPSKCYFIDDSTINCQAAILFGWQNTVQKLEPGDPEPSAAVTKHYVRDLEELRGLFPRLFKTA